MRPTLFTIGALPVRGFGLMVAIAFLVAIYTAARSAKRQNIPAQMIFDLGLYILISAMFGARIFYALQHPDSYSSLLDILKIWEGGLTYYGGFILAFVVAVVYLRAKKLSIAKVVDILAPSAILGIGIGRIGCFLAGCCFGKPTSLPWGVTFPKGSLPWMVLGLEKIHPTQLYSSFSLFIIFTILMTLRKHMKFAGEMFLTTVLFYSIFRFLVDFVRYYTPQEHVGVLTTSQFISMILGLLALISIIVLHSRNASKNKSAEAN